MAALIEAMIGPLGGILGALVVAVGIWLRGRHAGAQDAEQDKLKDEVRAHDRINNADTGGGATDAERIVELQRLADKWKRH